MVGLLRGQVHENDRPVVLELGHEPKPKRKDGPRPGSQEWFIELQSRPPRTDDGVDMRDMLNAAERERRSRRLPRSPEEARGTRWF